MLGRTIFTATFFALASFTAAASPPGCLLGAVNTYDTPADIKSVCNQKDMTKTIQKFCGDSTSKALEAFADVCNGAGVKVATNIPSSTGSASATRSASGSQASATGSSTAHVSGSMNSPSATGASKPTGSAAAGAASGTSSSSPAQNTNAAGRLEIGVAAALAGIFAIAL